MSDDGTTLKARLEAIQRIASGAEFVPPPIGLHAAATALCTAVEHIALAWQHAPVEAARMKMLAQAVRYAMQQVRLVRLELESAPAERLEQPVAPLTGLATAGADAVPREGA